MPRRLAWLPRLLESLAGSPITELEIETPGLCVFLRRRANPVVLSSGDRTSAVRVEEAPPADLIPIRTPLTGVYYAAPSPQSDPYVNVGDVVEINQVVALVEAMKVFNEIRSEHRGVVERFEAQNGQLVQAMQPLLYLRPAEAGVATGAPLPPPQ